MRALLSAAAAHSAPSEETSTLLSHSNTKLVVTAVGFIAMVPIVNPGNPVDDLSMRQLRDIFTGHISNFRQVGGRDVPIKVLVGSPKDGLTESWRAALIDASDHHTPRIIVLNANERRELVGADAAAI